MVRAMARPRKNADALQDRLDGVVMLLGRGFNQALKRDGLRPSDVQMLELVDRGDVPGVRDVANTLGVSRQAVAKVLGQLVAQGLLRGDTALGAATLSTSARGRALLARVRKQRQRQLDGVLKVLSRRERGDLSDLLGRVLEAARDG
jgi:DNA-binding MarR family transcriptional regulator